MFKAEGHVKPAVNIQAHEVAGPFDVREVPIDEIKRKSRPPLLNEGEETFVKEMTQKGGKPTIWSKRWICRFKDQVIVCPTDHCIGLEFMNCAVGLRMALCHSVDDTQ